MAWTDAPTKRQLELLYKLAGERTADKYGSCGEERIENVGAIVENRGDSMTRRDVSNWIDWFMKQPHDRTEHDAPAKREDTVDLSTLEYGIYELDGVLYAVKPSRGNHGRRYAAKVVPVSTGRLTGDGETEVKVEFHYEKGAIFRLRPEMRISVEEAERLSVEYRHCICCGHGIKVIDSVLRGIGPVCLTKYFSIEEQDRIKARVKAKKVELARKEKEKEAVPA